MKHRLRTAVTARLTARDEAHPSDRARYEEMRREGLSRMASDPILIAVYGGSGGAGGLAPFALIAVQLIAPPRRVPGYHQRSALFHFCR